MRRLYLNMDAKYDMGSSKPIESKICLQWSSDRHRVWCTSFKLDFAFDRSYAPRKMQYVDPVCGQQIQTTICSRHLPKPGQDFKWMSLSILGLCYEIGGVWRIEPQSIVLASLLARIGWRKVKSVTIGRKRLRFWGESIEQETFYVLDSWLQSRASIKLQINQGYDHECRTKLSKTWNRMLLVKALATGRAFARRRLSRVPPFDRRAIAMFDVR